MNELMKALIKDHDYTKHNLQNQNENIKICLNIKPYYKYNLQ